MIVSDLFIELKKVDSGNSLFLYFLVSVVILSNKLRYINNFKIT
jgi:hypothetical protein